MALVRSLALYSLALLVVYPPAVWARPEPTDLERAVFLITQGRPRAAAASLRAAAEAQPDSAVVWAAVGVAHLKLGDTTPALEAFAAAARLDQGSIPARLGVGAAFLAQGQYDQALQQYRFCTAFDCVDRATVRALAACSACLAGLYDSASAEAAQALQEDPQCVLAREVRAAVLLAQGSAQQALEELAQLPAGSGDDGLVAGRQPLYAPSPLYTPGAHYWIAHHLDQEQGGAGQGAAPTGAVAEILEPREGGQVTGRVSVSVAIGGPAEVDYVALLAGDRYQCLASGAPFELPLDTTRFADGPLELRVDVYGDGGALVTTATRHVVVRNRGERTYAPQEAARQAAISRQLERLLLLQPSPGSALQLRGMALREQGDQAQATAALEEALIAQVSLPLVRESLQRLYAESGAGARGRGRDIYALAPLSRGIALTFDDGPHPVLTPRILNILERRGVRATFFLVGKQVELYPELAREVVARGHDVGSHGFSHCDLTTLSAAEVERELVRSRHVIREATGRDTVLFRPPGGRYNAAVRQAAVGLGFDAVFWTANVADYPGREPSVVGEKLLAKLQPGGILLLHNGEDPSPELLDGLLAGLAGRGLPCVALADHMPPAAVPHTAAGRRP